MTITRRAAAGLLTAGLTIPSQAWAMQPEAIVPASQLADGDEPIAIETSSARTLHMLAPVMINGRGPYNFLMDTGANASCVSARVALELGLPASTPIRVTSMVGTRTWPRVIIAELQIGARVRRNVKAPSLMIREPSFDGVLGVDWLKSQRLLIDFAGNNVEIGKSKAERSEDRRVVVPARRREGQLTIVDADLGEQRISALIDTGSEVSVCNGALRAIAESQDKTPQAGERGEAVTIESITGEKAIGRSVHLPFVRLGGLTVGAATVVHADVHIFKLWGLEKTPALVLGMDLLTQFKAVALDYGRSVVRFDLA